MEPVADGGGVEVDEFTALDLGDLQIDRGSLPMQFLQSLGEIVLSPADELAPAARRRYSSAIR